MGNSSGNASNEQHIISETQLWRVSEKVMPGLQDKLGEILGLRIAEVDETRQASELTCFREATLKILLLWQEKLTQGSKDPFETLTKILKELDIWEKNLINYKDDEDHMKYVSKSSKPDKGILSEIQLRCVANRIPTEKYIPVGLYLGLRYKDIAEIWTKSNAHVSQAAFEMLRTWKQKQDSLVNQTKTLVKVLVATQQMKLADEVGKGIGLKIDLYETRKVFLLAVKINKYLGVDDDGNVSFFKESEDNVEQDRYVVYLHIFNTSKTDKTSEGSPVLVCCSSRCLGINDTSDLCAQEGEVKPKLINQSDERFFYYQTQDDGLSTLRNLTTAKYICADSSSPPHLGEDKGTVVRFKELPYKRR